MASQTSNDAAEPSLTQRAAMIRTRLALERTLMAWVRTAVSLITFGFTLYKAYEYAREHGLARDTGIMGPRQFALAMITMGLVALVLATVQHYRHARALNRMSATELPVFSIGSVIAVAFSALGFLALISAALRR